MLNPFAAIADIVVPGVVGAVDVDDVVGRIDVEALIDRVDINALVARIDINTILERADINALLARVDANALLDRVDADALVSRVDANAVVARVDVDALLDRADIDALLTRVDIDALLARVDANALLARIDIAQLIDRIDLDAVIARVDIDAVIDRVDIDRIVQRANLADIVAESTRGITANSIDLVRRQLVGVDVIATRVAARIVRRDPAGFPAGPDALRPDPAAPTPRRGPTVSGQYAGPVSRAVAMGLDVVTLIFLFGMATAITTWTLDRLFHTDLAAGNFEGWFGGALFLVWAFSFFAIPLAMTGRTFGKAVVGLRVVRRDGAPVPASRVALRVLALPFSTLLLGAGLIGGVFGRERRTLHDVIAGTTEVIDWGDRPAALPTPLARWIEQHRPADAT